MDMGIGMWVVMGIMMIQAYAKDGKVVCFFQSAANFKSRYATVGFSDKAKLDEGAMWPTSYALRELTPAEEKKLAALVMCSSSGSSSAAGGRGTAGSDDDRLLPLGVPLARNRERVHACAMDECGLRSVDAGQVSAPRLECRRLQRAPVGERQRPRPADLVDRFQVLVASTSD